MIRFFVPLPDGPVAKGRPRFSRRSGRAYTPPRTAKAEAAFAALSAPYAPEDGPMTGPLRVHVALFFGIPKSWPKWRWESAKGGFHYHVNFPDVDNAAKLILDSLGSTGLFWADDRQVMDLHVRKSYSAGQPGVWVWITELEQGGSS